jgi:hypothetical protein
MFGDALQNATQINFFTGQNFQGTERVVNAAGNGNVGITAGSYFFTGPNSWQVGNQCLNITSSFIRENGYGFTYVFGANLQVGSVTYGCNPTTVPTQTTMRPTSAIPPITTPRPTTTKPPIVIPTTHTITTSTKGSGGFSHKINSIVFIGIVVLLFKVFY